MAEEKDPLGLQQTKSIPWYKKNRGLLFVFGFLNAIISLILFIGFALTGLLSGPLLTLPIVFLVCAVVLVTNNDGPFSESDEPSSPAEITPEATFEAYRKAADGGDRMAQYRLAECYELGTGCIQSFEEALKHYEQLARSSPVGDDAKVMAKRKLGQWYQEGFHVEKNLSIAYDHYSSSASYDAKSSYQFGKLYEEWAVVPPRDEKEYLTLALLWFKSALRHTSDNAIKETINNAIAQVSKKIINLGNRTETLHTPPLFTPDNTSNLPVETTTAKAAEQYVPVGLTGS
jgi:TPR repeat protein